MLTLCKKHKVGIIATSIVFLVFLAFHAVVFRDIVTSFGPLLAGEEVVAREELVPFFNLQTQFLDQIRGGESRLTNTDEVRVAYSFWSSWVRYVFVLPFALIILNTISGTILWASLVIFVRTFFREKLPYVYILTAALAFALHSIQLYSKITHFYTLIFGFSLFALSLALTIRMLTKKQASRYDIFAISALVLLNPAIHFHFLYYITVGLYLLIDSVLQLVASVQKEVWKRIWQRTLSFIYIGLISGLPYMILVFWAVSHSAASVADTIPVNYLSILYQSVSALQVFSLETASQVDLFTYGAYIIDTPRWGKMTITILFASMSLFALTHAHRLPVRQGRALVTTMILILIAVWMSFGYNYGFSFHTMTQKFVLATQWSILFDPIHDLFSTLIQVLRFPHRFVFILQPLLFFILSFGLVLIVRSCSRKYLVTGFFSVVILTSIFVSSDYRKVLLSGDFGGFLQPYEIPTDLQNIKVILGEDSNPDKLLFILPTMESGRELEGESRVSFIDKFLIYFLDTPTFYYGTGARSENKIRAFMVYRGLLYKESWWDDFLASNIQADYVLIPHTSGRALGLVYAANLEDLLPEALAESDNYQVVYSGKDYSLYARTTNTVDTYTTMLHISDWQTLVGRLKTTATRQDSERLFFPLQYADFIGDSVEKKRIITDSIEASYYDLYTAVTPESRATIDYSILPFSENPLPSTFYTNNALALFSLFNPRGTYNYYNEAVPAFINMTSGSFLGTTAPGTVSVTYNNKNPDVYRIIIKGYITDLTNTEIRLNDVPVSVRVVEEATSPSYASFVHYVVDVPLSEGLATLEISSDYLVLVDAVSLIPKDEVPAFTTPVITTDQFLFNKVDEATYEVTQLPALESQPKNTLLSLISVASIVFTLVCWIVFRRTRQTKGAALTESEDLHNAPRYIPPSVSARNILRFSSVSYDKARQDVVAHPWYLVLAFVSAVAAGVWLGAAIAIAWLFFLLVLLYRWDARFVGLAAVVTLATCPLLLAFSNTQIATYVWRDVSVTIDFLVLAERVAVYAFLLLVITVVLQAVEFVRVHTYSENKDYENHS